MGSLKVLSMCVCLITVMDAAPSSNRPMYTKSKVPEFARDGRPECNLVTKLSELSELPNCSLFLPITETFTSFDYEVLRCFGAYDTHYQLCKYNSTLSEIKKDYEAKEFCGKAKTAFAKYKSSASDPLFKTWVQRLKNTFSVQEGCSHACISKETVHKACGKIVAAIELYYPEKLKKTTTVEQQPTIPSIIKTSSSPLPKETILSVTNSGQSLIPMLYHDADPAKKQENVSQQITPLKSISPAGAMSGQIVPSVEQNNPGKINAPMGDEMDNPADPPQLSSLVASEAKKEKTGEPVEPEDPENMEEGAMMGRDSLADSKNLGEQDPIPVDETMSVDNNALQDPDKEAPKMEGGLDSEDPMAPLVMSRMNDDEESNLVTYFILMTGGAALFYVAFHNKNKLLALALEGRRANRRGGRHSSAAYSKLHSNLEEAIAAGPTSPSATHVLY